MRRQAWLITGYCSDIGSQSSTKTFRGMFMLLLRPVLLWAANFGWVPNAPVESGLSRSLICKSTRSNDSRNLGRKASQAIKNGDLGLIFPADNLSVRNLTEKSLRSTSIGP